MSPPFVTIIEETGEVPTTAPDIDSVCAFIGAVSANTTNQPGLYGRAEALYSIFTEGPGIRAAGHCIRKSRIPQVFQPTPMTVPGTYGTIDVSGVTGTAVVSIDNTSPPLNDYSGLYVTVTNGGPVGVPGIKIQYATDGDAGVTLSGITNLGTQTSFAIPGTGAVFDFNPPATPLVTLVNGIRTSFLAHASNTGGVFHTHTDNTAYTISGACTDIPSAIILINQLRGAYEAHRVLLTETAGAVHGAADTVNVVSAAIATDGVTAVTLANDLRAKLNAHEIDITGGVHALADTFNAVTASLAGLAILNTGDTWQVVGIGPKWSSDDLTAAFSNLAETGLDFSMVYVAGQCSSTEAGVVSAGLDTLLGQGKRCGAVILCRPQNVGEAETTWINAVVTDYESFFDDRITVAAGTAWVQVQEGSKVRKYSTTFAYAVMARLIMINRFQSPGEVDLGSLDGVSLVDSQGNRIGHDESWIGGLDEGRFMALCRLPDPTRRFGAYVSHPYVMKGPDDRVSTFQVRRVVNAAERTASSVGFGEIGLPGIFDPSTSTITITAADNFAAKIKAPLSSEFGSDISNPNDPNLVVVSTSVTTDGDDMYLTVTINLIPFKYVGGLTITIQILV